MSIVTRAGALSASAAHLGCRHIRGCGFFSIDVKRKMGSLPHIAVLAFQNFADHTVPGALMLRSSVGRLRHPFGLLYPHRRHVLLFIVLETVIDRLLSFSQAASFGFEISFDPLLKELIAMRILVSRVARTLRQT